MMNTLLLPDGARWISGKILYSKNCLISVLKKLNNRASWSVSQSAKKILQFFHLACFLTFKNKKNEELQ